jgi:SAM-dependent methyltransferase
MKLSSIGNQYKLILNAVKRLENRKYKILEVGASERDLSKYLPKNIIYHSLDFGDNHDFNFNLDSGKFPIADGTYDFVICLETLEHVMYPENVIREMKRVAKKDALFFLSLPNDYNFLLRIYYLIGKKTFFDEPFKVVEKHLHIHKPRVNDILNLFSKYFEIKEVDYIWQSRHSAKEFKSSFIMGNIDKIINQLAQIAPGLFARLVSIKATNRH